MARRPNSVSPGRGGLVGAPGKGKSRARGAGGAGPGREAPQERCRTSCRPTCGPWSTRRLSPACAIRQDAATRAASPPGNARSSRSPTCASNPPREGAPPAAPAPSRGPAAVAFSKKASTARASCPAMLKSVLAADGGAGARARAAGSPACTRLRAPLARPGPRPGPRPPWLAPAAPRDVCRIVILAVRLAAGEPGRNAFGGEVDGGDHGGRKGRVGGTSESGCFPGARKPLPKAGADPGRGPWNSPQSRKRSVSPRRLAGPRPPEGLRAKPNKNPRQAGAPRGLLQAVD